MRRLVIQDAAQSFEIGGVTFSCWPAGQFQRDLAETNARTFARRLQEASELANELALPAGMVTRIVGGALQMAADGDEQGADQQLAGYGTHLYAVELAMICIQSWEGLQGLDGETPANIDRRNISTLFLTNIGKNNPLTFAAMFVEKIHRLAALEVSEGNGSAVGQSESSVPAAKPVETAQTSERPAHKEG